ncbi:MAG: asparagine synthase (glutamine-hydrolyzing) [Deltaproteobacteria bacterium]|nr:asparagine synthase (glutamine-hydrolyzing) [Deltaproteobacteria bacterium]
MCGIIGWIGTGRAPDIGAGLAALKHRGPDARETWCTEDGPRFVALGHARLAILDLSERAVQPMQSRAGDVVIVFNGEIYNFLELRTRLEALGVVFRTTSDTEVILEGYLRWGHEVLRQLRGMFAFAIWDRRDGSTWLVRDRLGIKPLFVARVPGGLAFASEMKGLFALGIPRTIARGAIDRYLTYLYVPGPETAFEGVREVLPAHELLVDREGRVTEARYWDVPEPQETRRDRRELAAEIRAELEVVMAQHAIADVPVGAFLSGGLDSSTIVGLMQQRSSTPLRTFCMTFGEGEQLYDERGYAREVANWFGTEHTEIAVRPQLVELLPRMFAHFDQPFGNPTALLSYELSRLTREHVTVALAGDGGDELFLGYPRYAGLALASASRWIPRSARQLVADAVAPRIRESVSGNHRYRRAREFLSTTTLPLEARYQRWIGYFEPSERAALLRPEHLAEEPPESYLASIFHSRPRGDDVERASYADLRSFLPNNILAYGDRMSMAHGLELRVPYCDHVLVELVAKIPAPMRMPMLSMKSLFRDAVRDLLPKRILGRPKLGFNPPMGIWITRDLGALVDAYLSPRALKDTGLFQPDAVAALLAELRGGRRDVSLHVWAVLVTQAWLRSL